MPVKASTIAATDGCQDEDRTPERGDGLETHRAAARKTGQQPAADLRAPG
jgi:hypothetical protein